MVVMLRYRNLHKIPSRLTFGICAFWKAIKTDESTIQDGRNSSN